MRWRIRRIVKRNFFITSFFTNISKLLHPHQLTISLTGDISTERQY